MPKTRVLSLALLICALAGGLLLQAPASLAQPNQSVEASSSNGGGGKVLFEGSGDPGDFLFGDQGTCHINCIEEPDITVINVDSREECIAICERYCGGSCA